MAIDDKIKALTKQLYPTGRVWRINPNSIKEKFVNGLLASEIRAYNDGVSILDSTLPDNTNFSASDASAWEIRLGLPDGSALTLSDRVKAIEVQLNWPGTNPAKGAVDYIQAELQAAGYNVCVHENIFYATSIGSWTVQVSAADNSWTSVCYGNGLFVAVAKTGTGNRVMTSPDGITWTIRSSAADNDWVAITFGNGLFVAVAGTGTGNRVMTSVDGITWTIRSSAANNYWDGVCYGNGLFVAVSFDGASNRCMTSPDGITWTIRTTPNGTWVSIAFGNNTFVAVSITNGLGNKVMTSPNGITWTLRSDAADNQWTSVTYGNGLFVAISQSGTGNRVMTSPDGITWTIRSSAADNFWFSVIYAGIFIAIAYSGTSTSVMTSSDGITWISSSIPINNTWVSLAFGNSTLVSVGQSGSGNRVMTNPIANAVFYKTYAQFAGTGLVRHISTLLHGQQRHGYLSQKGIIVANSVDPSVDDSFNIGDGSDTIFIGGCPAGTFINIPKAQETAFRQFILKIKPVNITVLLLVNFV